MESPSDSSHDALAQMDARNELVPGNGQNSEEGENSGENSSEAKAANKSQLEQDNENSEEKNNSNSGEEEDDESPDEEFAPGQSSAKPSLLASFYSSFASKEAKPQNKRPRYLFFLK